MPYLQHVKLLNKLIIQQNPEIKQCINDYLLNGHAYQLHLEHMSTIDQGGFNHASLSGFYVQNQNSQRYGSTRLCGWSNIFNCILSYVPINFSWDSRLIIDFLAGSGTLSKKLKQLIPNTLKIFNLLISQLQMRK